MDTPTKYAVFGSGSWATAIVKMLCENLDEVGWYMRSIYIKEHLLKEQHNPSYLSSVEFKTSQLKLSNDMNEMAAYADVLIFVIPSAFIHDELEKMTVSVKDKIIVSAVKGIMPETGKLVGEHFHDIYEVPFENIAVISGPCHAEEVALERLSYLTIACADESKAKEIAKNLASDYIKTSTSDDVIGIEYAVMLKNIYAIAAGIAHGLGYGDNFQSVLMSNAIREMKRFIKKRHKMKRNINDSAYLGDLLVTGYSLFSRNRMFGNMIGKGYTVKSAQMEMNMVAEGYYATKSAYRLIEKGEGKGKLPIIEAIYGILYEGKDPKRTFQKLIDKLD
ncbi:glycerol-3-phosphate dehydrogenase (NAD(P)+) [Gelidibacter algens]|uniref:Glycerol-3-phosphate dehydrogenase n=1 Tax=Gelidibacter algens TaxID=49280 RepID=A0A1A7R242_9FLAO|nr:NAD(P)H-dependent glycerol-3-phosphate dehydrogenase [Gelidibacter algens]OBX26330.1 glycerol-3-phosphate dehydrogenase [Gelidibacter algens]RAJ25836.1 glycerol-3-phosphate dehydrogenase (NAD(P)+) [Gelidibacter algens]